MTKKPEDTYLIVVDDRIAYKSHNLNRAIQIMRDVYWQGEEILLAKVVSNGKNAI